MLFHPRSVPGRSGDSCYPHLKVRQQQFLGELKYLLLAGLEYKLGPAASAPELLDTLSGRQSILAG